MDNGSSPTRKRSNSEVNDEGNLVKKVKNNDAEIVENVVAVSSGSNQRPNNTPRRTLNLEKMVSTMFQIKSILFTTDWTSVNRLSLVWEKYFLNLRTRLPLVKLIIEKIEAKIQKDKVEIEKLKVCCNRYRTLAKHFSLNAMTNNFHSSNYKAEVIFLENVLALYSKKMDETVKLAKNVINFKRRLGKMKEDKGVLDVQQAAKNNAIADDFENKIKYLEENGTKNESPLKNANELILELILLIEPKISSILEKNATAKKLAIRLV